MNLKIMQQGYDELQRQTELDRIEIEKEPELGLENSHSVSDDHERKCELELGPNSEESRMIEPEQEVQTSPNLLTYQELEVEGTSGADADIIKNTKEQGEDPKEDKIQPNLEPQAQSEYQSGSQSQVEADDEDNRDEQALALLFADTLLKGTSGRRKS